MFLKFFVKTVGCRKISHNSNVDNTLKILWQIFLFRCYTLWDYFLDKINDLSFLNYNMMTYIYFKVPLYCVNLITNDFKIEISIFLWYLGWMSRYIVDILFALYREHNLIKFRNTLDYTHLCMRALIFRGTEIVTILCLAKLVLEVSRLFACVIPNVVYVTIILVRKTCNSPVLNFATLN